MVNELGRLPMSNGEGGGGGGGSYVNREGSNTIRLLLDIAGRKKPVISLVLSRLEICHFSCPILPRNLSFLLYFLA